LPSFAQRSRRLAPESLSPSHRVARARLVRLAALLLLALVCAGCVSHAPAPPTPRPRAVEPVAPLALAPPPAPRPPPPTLQASLSLSELWLKPLGEETATLAAPAGTSVSWFASIRGITSHLLVWNDGIYVTADHVNRVATYPATGDLPPGAAAAMRLHEAGRMTFVSTHHPGASLVVTVRPDAPPEARAFLVGEPGAERFVPDAVEVRPEGLLTFLNEAQTVGDATGTSFLVLLPETGPTLRVTGVDEGLYDLLAVVRDGSGAQAELRGRFLVDFDRPDAETRFGPYSGTFEQPGAANAVLPGAAFSFNASYPVRSLVVSYHATSRAPVPASVRVTLLREGEPVASASSATSQELRLSDLPAGRYRVQVDAEQGALVDWDAAAGAVYRQRAERAAAVLVEEEVARTQHPGDVLLLPRRGVRLEGHVDPEAPRV